jgi:hypothetical protein
MQQLDYLCTHSGGQNSNASWPWQEECTQIDSVLMAVVFNQALRLTENICFTPNNLRADA